MNSGEDPDDSGEITDAVGPTESMQVHKDESSGAAGQNLDDSGEDTVPLRRDPKKAVSFRFLFWFLCVTTQGEIKEGLLVSPMPLP